MALEEGLQGSVSIFPAAANKHELSKEGEWEKSNCLRKKTSAEDVITQQGDKRT